MKAQLQKLLLLTALLGVSALAGAQTSAQPPNAKQDLQAQQQRLKQMTDERQSQAQAIKKQYERKAAKEKILARAKKDQ